MLKFTCCRNPESDFSRHESMVMFCFGKKIIFMSRHNEIKEQICVPELQAFVDLHTFFCAAKMQFMVAIYCVETSGDPLSTW